MRGFPVQVAGPALDPLYRADTPSQSGSPTDPGTNPVAISNFLTIISNSLW